MKKSKLRVAHIVDGTDPDLLRLSAEVSEEFRQVERGELVRCAECNEYRSVGTDDQGFLVSDPHVCATKYVLFEDGSFTLYEDAMNDLENGLYESVNYQIVAVPDHVGDSEEAIACWISKQ